jgi:hypothetical protein
MPKEKMKVVYPEDPEFGKLLAEGKLTSGADANAEQKNVDDVEEDEDKDEAIV